MKVSKSWLKELVDLKVSLDELINLIPLRVQGGIKEVSDNYIELDLKGYNRSDLLSMRGVALEVAAITSSPVKFKEPKNDQYLWIEHKHSLTPVSVEETTLSPIQAVAKIEGLKFGTSKEEWIKKIKDSGMRPVNNIADVTNLAMLEYGHPLHAFDAATVKNDTINVRRAKDGEEIVTLDGKLRKLTSEDIVLADEEKALDVAGVMGGKNTEIKESTQTILLSASLFNPSMVRKTSVRLGLSSEASKRFYHGLTRKRLLQALDAAIRMYQSLGGKLTALTIVGEAKDEVKKVPLRLGKTRELIGVDLTEKQVEEYLKKLNFTLSDKVIQDGEVSWVVTPPYYRLDIEIEEDLIEEVARMYGYENIPAKELKGNLPEKTSQKLFEFIYDLKKQLVEVGLTEVQTYSFYSTEVLKNFNVDKNQLVKIANPISSETEYLRIALNPNLVEVAAKNIKQGSNEVAVFEIGKIYKPLEGKKPEERYKLAILIASDSKTLPSAVFNLVRKTEYLKNIQAQLVENADYFSHPKRFWDLSLDGKEIGFLKELHPRIANKFGINEHSSSSNKRVAILEIQVEKLEQSSG